MRRFHASAIPIYDNIENQQVGPLLIRVAFQLAIGGFVWTNTGTNILDVEITVPKHRMDNSADYRLLN